MIVMHASFPIDPDERDRALSLIDDLVEQSQAEDGTIEYRATTDLDDPNVVRILEQYEDAAAFESHSQSDHLREFAEVLPELLAGEPEVIRFEVESATEVDM